MSEVWNELEWNGHCTCCNGPINWEGDSPEAKEEAICDRCLRKQLIELRKRVTNLENE